MLIVMSPTATESEVDAVIARLVEKGFDVHRSTGAERTVLGAVGHIQNSDPRFFEDLPGVSEVVRISEPYKLAGRTFQPRDSVISVRGVPVGGDEVVVMAGPCTIETRDQMFESAKAVAKAGARILRGGAFKPRTSPYSYQGMGIDGWKLLREAGDAFGLATVSEVMDASQIEDALPYVDLLQVGARNMQNFTFLKELGKIRRPVLLKRGLSATIEEWLLSAEYVMAGGNRDVILCERGIRTFERYTRNTLDISAIPVVEKLSHLPVVADPSHGTGHREQVAPMALAAAAAGADGLLIEVHPDPDHALCDGPQSLLPAQFERLMDALRIVAPAVGKRI
ncbi:MAG TPA: 3-deoxy-7-phosphoheptulonate synthase [Thermoanaerobaculia bacterium]|jgi:3-deoxy-7-phosphoheptulonate synthase|nr:3-deoxy-7-phosphoheptulonate synthase [Thermoanaerobaculia bacterium]